MTRRLRAVARHDRRLHAMEAGGAEREVEDRTKGLRDVATSLRVRRHPVAEVGAVHGAAHDAAQRDFPDERRRVLALRNHEDVAATELPLATLPQHGLRNLGDRGGVLAGRRRRIPRLQVLVVRAEQTPDLRHVRGAGRPQHQPRRDEAGRQRRSHAASISQQPDGIHVDRHANRTRELGDRSVDRQRRSS